MFSRDFKRSSVFRTKNYASILIYFAEVSTHINFQPTILLVVYKRNCKLTPHSSFEAAKVSEDFNFVLNRIRCKKTIIFIRKLRMNFQLLKVMTTRLMAYPRRECYSQYNVITLFKVLICSVPLKMICFDDKWRNEKKDAWLRRNNKDVIGS